MRCMFKISKFIFSISIMFLLSSCDYNIEFSNFEYISDIEHLENIVEVSNNLGEQYRVEYEERNGFPSQRMKINVYKSEEFIINYNPKFDKDYIPNKILYLFSDSDYDYYYIANNYNENIVKYNKKNYERYNPVIINVDYCEMEYVDRHITFSETMRKNIDRQELIDKFQACEYDDKYILALYDLSK